MNSDMMEQVIGVSSSASVAGELGNVVAQRRAASQEVRIHVTVEYGRTDEMLDRSVAWPLCTATREAGVAAP